MFTRIFLLFLWWPLLTAGQQEPGGLYLTGKITTEQGNVNGAIIRMTRNGQPMKDYQVLPDGRFDLRFEFNNDYVLIFQREENFPQKIVISTQVPAEVLRRDRKFPPFPVDVNLFTEIKGVDRTFSENAIMKIFYSPSVDNFIPEIYYNNPQIKRLIDQAIWQSQNVSREAGLLRKLSAAELAELKKEYDELLKKAGSEFDKGDYIASLGDYKSASRIFPSEQYPKDRMAEINDLIAILGLQAELDRQNAEKYNGFIREADRLFGVKSWPGARENYTQALFVKPGDAYANGQLSAIDKAIALEEQTRLADEKARLEAERLAQLEAERKAAEADKARQEAEKAQQEAERLARLEADKEQQYTSAVANADQAFTRQEYQQAITGYKDALKIKSGEVYPTTRITEAETILAELAAARKTYDAAVATGDKAFRQQNYRQSRRAFEDAQKALSNEPYPAQMLEKIDAIEEELERLAQEKDRIAAQKAAEELAARQAAEAEKLRLAEEKARAEAEEQARLQSEQALREEQYQSTIKEADRLAGENLLIEAVGKFRAALEIKPRESYPIQRIEEIRGIIARQNETRKAYETAVATGDQEFKNQNYGPARNAFTEAQNLIPAEKYPGEMISKIETLEAEQARLAEEKARIEAERLAKLEADRQAAEAEKARIAAEKAAKEEAARLAAEAERQRLADEKARLAEEKARIEAERLAKLEADRQAAEAEKARIAAEKAAKEEAARLAAEAERQRLADEKARIAEEKARIEAERLAKLEADRQAAEAEKARIAAEKAAKEEAARLAAEAERQRLADEKARLAAQKEAESAARTKVITDETEALYAGMITTADQTFTAKEYNVSRAWYYKALEVKPGEPYPTGQIAEINRIVGSQQMSQREREFQETIDKGDEAFRAGEMAVARGWYNRSLTIKPEDQYARSQIADIQMKIAEKLQGHTETSFLDYLKEGDKALAGKNYHVARVWYHRARQLKPDDPRVAEKLQNLEKAMAEE